MLLSFGNEIKEFLIVYTGVEGKLHLSFKDNNFVLIKNGIEKSIDLAGAFKFRRYGDQTAKRVINRSFAKFYNTPQLPPLKFLDPHQREGIKWILSRSRSYLAHAPGAGKTCQAIVASLLSSTSGSVLFIVPPTLTLNWQREVVQFSSLMGIYSTVSIVPLSAEELSMNWEADFIICPDSMITKRWVYKNLLHLKKKFIAVDEASRLKECTTQRSKAFYGGKIDEINYPGLFQDCSHCVFLDGSPMPNRPMELWAPCYALNPWAIGFMDYSEYGRRYCGPRINERGHWEFKHSSNENELKARLQKNFMHVVREDELEHPERLRSMLFINEEVRTPSMKEWERKNLKAILSHPLKEGAERADLAHQRKEIGLRKTHWVANYVKDRLENKNESILLFAWHREVCEALSLYLEQYKPDIIYGGVTNDKREKAFRAFQSGARRLLIGNIQALGRGHNLQRADRVIFAEYSWTDELNKQCEKRSSRRGNNKSHIRCEYIVAPDSMDEIILNSVFTKAARVKKIVG